MMRRKNYFIKKKFQLNFSYGFVLLLVLECALITGLFMHLASNTITTGYTNSVLSVQRTSDFFLVSFALIGVITAVAMVMAGIAIFIFLSHRIAGPLFRFEKTLKELESGDLTSKISLRKTDQLIEMKEALNALIDVYDKRLGRIKKLARSIHAAAEKDSKVMEKIGSESKDLEKELSHFKVTSDQKG